MQILVWCLVQLVETAFCTKVRKWVNVWRFEKLSLVMWNQFYRKLEFVSRPNELNRSCEHAGGVNQLSLLISRSPRLKPAAHIICLHAEQVRPQTHDIGKVWNTWYYTESIIIIFDFPEQSVIISDIGLSILMSLGQSPNVWWEVLFMKGHLQISFRCA